jgi:hypothetical protein
MATIFQSDLLTNFLYPFLLIFFIVFAILEKTKILGDDKKSINAVVSLVIGLIFVGAVFPKIIVENMVLFMTVGLVIIFVVLLLWGFITGETPNAGPKWKKFYAWLVGIAVVVAVIWASGIGGAFISGLQSVLTFLFDSKWSGTFWSNFLFVALIAGAIAIVLKKAPSSGSSGSSGD